MRHARDHGVKQFVSRYRKVEGIENDELKWGDEVRGDKDYALVCSLSWTLAGLLRFSPRASRMLYYSYVRAEKVVARCS